MSNGWKLEPACRAALLEQFPPRYARTDADHVTLWPSSAGGIAAEPPPQVGRARIIGRADDCRGVEAMAVEIDGSATRPDGGTWHITWSLAEGRKPSESNRVLAEHGFTAIDDGPVVALIPARW